MFSRRNYLPKAYALLLKRQSCPASFAAIALSIVLLFAGVSQSDARLASGVHPNAHSSGVLNIPVDGGEIILRPYDFGAIHVRFVASGGDSGQTASYAVVSDFPPADCKVHETDDRLSLETHSLSVVYDKRAGTLTFRDAARRTLLTETARKVRQSVFRLSSSGEALYGLGQFRDHALNLRGKTRELVQVNTQAAVPVLLSTAGWGLFWDNPSRTVFKDDNEDMRFTSDHGMETNYYLFTGGSLDELVGAFRRLTGQAPMLPLWALGYHQSRNKYATQAEVSEVVRRMEEEDIPFSSIFIDYFYWNKYGTGSHRFDETLFPSPEKLLDTLHRHYRTHAVITVWPTFKQGTDNYRELQSQGLLLEGAKALDGIIYDVFNPKAREVYWKQLQPLVETGIDGWFLDGPEPDHVQSFLPAITAAGPALSVRNLYPLLHSENFYTHYRRLYPNKRPYLLTRCAWASQQRNGTSVWSGDIPTTFDELKRQITAGLNFTATGIPYWTTDIGGYSGGDPADEAYRELFVRWFEYGVFCPIFRSHGRRYPGDTHAPNELWAYGAEAQKICTDYIRLRYALTPYIYSLSGLVTHRGYTPMRLLAFDFPNDPTVVDCKDEFMYGPSFLVCPVTDAHATQRQVYLPENGTWVDFRTGQPHCGGQTITADAPLGKIPLYVKAGSIIPVHPARDTEYASGSPLRLYVFTGDDGSFDLYGDDGISFDYEHGAYSFIPFRWNNRKRELTVRPCKGNYMNGKALELQIVLVENTYQDLYAIPVTKTVLFMGEEQVIRF
jgi:alpha-D-xyloside xylohydrolase